MKKDKRHTLRHMMAVILFSMAVSLGITCFADEEGKVTVPSAKIRASADPGSEQLGSAKQGGTVDIIGETTGTDGKKWYQVYVNADTKGFIRADLVETNGASIPTLQGSAGSAPTTSSTTATDQPATSATPVDARKAVVTTNNVHIRKGASTSHESLAKANKGMVLTVTGEANGTDGKKWYQVTFTHNDKEVIGFIRSDLVSFDNVPADVAESQITGEENGGEAAPEENPEDVPQETDPAPEEPSSGDPTDIVLLNTDDKPYIMPGFDPVTVKWNGEKISAYFNGKFYIYYARMQNGEEGWYLYDSERGVYQRYVYTTPDSTIPDDIIGGVGLIPIIILVAVVIILAAIVGLLAIKLRSYSSYDDDDYDEDDDDYPDDDIDDIDELEDEDMDPQPVRRPQSARRPQPQGEGAPQGRPQPRPVQGGPQPARRPQPQGGNAPQGQQPTRRPQPQGGNAPQGQQPARRPQPQGGSAPLGHPQGQQPARRPQPQGEGAPQGRPQPRPTQAQGHPQGRPQPQGKRPQPQRDRPQPQKGGKGRNQADRDDDIHFMDDI